MESIEFVSAIKKMVIENGNHDYKNILNSHEAQDSLWKEIILFYKDLTTEKKELFLEFIRLIQVNTVSHMFGILDGSSYLNEEREDFVLQTSPDKKILNGDLQDLFLEMEG